MILRFFSSAPRGGRPLARTSRAARSALMLGLLAAVLATYAATSAGAPRARGAAVPTATVKIALDWTPNVNYLGIYVAESKGYFAAEHIKPVILPYANADAEQLIQAGQTDLGISYPPDVIINNANGTLHYKALAALISDNTTALAVLASSKYTRPAQLNGKLYGGFGIASDKPLVTAILHADGVKHPIFKQVVLEANAVTALAAHRVDYTAVFGGIDDVTAALQGIKLRTFPYKNYLGSAGDYPNAVFVASDKDIAARGPVLARALKALAEGYEYAARNPAAAEAMLIADNRTALSNAKRIVDATGNATAPHFDDHAGLWGPETDADYAGLERILAGSHLIKASPAMSTLYTNALLPSG
jgi:ABC-type nitrate/sulfonate/bicarbonate transport system substrate-binding protein